MTSTATHLRTCALHWADLREAAGTPALVGAFGLGLRGYLARLDELDADRAVATAALTHAAERADSNPEALGERPVPVRLAVLDTMRAVEAALVDCADQTAAIVQRSPMTYAPRGWPAADRARRDQLARADALDPRRWRYTGQRTAPYAALWLLARITRAGGPFTALPAREEQRIATVAAGAAGRVERALDIAAQTRTLEQRHDGCGGAIDIHGGEGRAPLAHCRGCGQVWAGGSGAVAA